MRMLHEFNKSWVVVLGKRKFLSGISHENLRSNQHVNIFLLSFPVMMNYPRDSTLFDLMIHF